MACKRRRGDDAVALDEIRLTDRAEPALRRLQQTLAARRRGVEVGGDAGARVLQERRERRAADALADAAPRRGLLGLELLELGVGERLSGREAEPARRAARAEMAAKDGDAGWRSSQSIL